MILIIDNYDSFTYNLAQYVGALTEVAVVRNDAVDLRARAAEADGLIFSPGPGWPADAGQMEALIAEFAGKKPMLGICLGFQAMVEVFGGKLRLAHQVRHGKESLAAQENTSIRHLGNDSLLFKGLAPEFPVMRYHSIVMDETVPLNSFAVTLKTLDDNEIMAIENADKRIYGLQFHPESIGTPDGMKMVENFVGLVKNQTVAAGK